MTYVISTHAHTTPTHTQAARVSASEGSAPPQHSEGRAPDSMGITRQGSAEINRLLDCFVGPLCWGSCVNMSP